MFAGNSDAITAELHLVSTAIVVNIITVNSANRNERSSCLETFILKSLKFPISKFLNKPVLTKCMVLYFEFTASIHVLITREGCLTHPVANNLRTVFMN